MTLATSRTIDSFLHLHSLTTHDAALQTTYTFFWSIALRCVDFLISRHSFPLWCWEVPTLPLGRVLVFVVTRTTQRSSAALMAHTFVSRLEIVSTLLARRVSQGHGQPKALP
jgi:hypothetical protein